MLGGRGRFDVVLAEAQVRVRHAGVNRLDAVRDTGDARDLFAVEPRGNCVDQLGDDERLLGVGLHDLRVDHLAADVEKGGHVDAVARFEQLGAVAGARVHHPHPMVTVGHEGLGQVAEAEVVCLEMALLQRFAQVGRRPLRAVQIVTSAEFTVFDAHVFSPAISCRVV